VTSPVPSKPPALQALGPIPAWILVVAVGVVAYANSLTVPWQFDDHTLVTDPAFTDFRLAPAGQLLGDLLAVGGRRLVGDLSFAVGFRVFGLSPVGHHAVNVAIHLAAALLLLRLVRLLARTAPLRATFVERDAGAIALAAALLFVAHPLQTQAVTYVVQRYASLAAALFLASVVSYLEARLAATRASAARWYVAFLAAAAAAVLTKESAFTLPLAVAAAELLFFDARPSARLAWLSPFLLAGAAVAVAIAAGPLPLARVDAVTRLDQAIPRGDYFLTQLQVVAEYLGLLVAPVGQNLDHDVRLVTGLGAPSTWLALGLHVGLVGAGVAAAVQGRRGSPWLLLVAYGIAWFYATNLVESSIIPIPDLMFEHRAYLPSVGFFLVAASLIDRFPATGWDGRKTIAVGCAVALLATLTVARNRVWRDDLSLWSDAAAKSPGKPRPLNNVGVALSARGRHAEAAAWYERAIAADPRYSKAWFNLGETWQQLGRCDLAVPWLGRFAQLHPGYPEVHARLAECAAALGDPAAAALHRADEARARARTGDVLPLFYR
jgi:tetratricopeptide (TPR) repeat protein